MDDRTDAGKTDKRTKSSPRKPVIKLDPSLKNLRPAQAVYAEQLIPQGVEDAKLYYSNVVPSDNLDQSDPLKHSGVQFRATVIEDKIQKTVYVFVRDVKQITDDWSWHLNERAKDNEAVIHVVPMLPKPESFLVALHSLITGGSRTRTTGGALGALLLLALLWFGGKTLGGKPPEWMIWAWSYLSPSMTVPPPPKPAPSTASPVATPIHPSGKAPPASVNNVPPPDALASVPPQPDPLQPARPEPRPPPAPASVPTPAPAASLDDMIQAWFQSGVAADPVIRQRYGDVTLHYDDLATSPRSPGVWDCGLTARVLTGQDIPVVFDEPFSLTASGTRPSVCEQVVRQIVSRVANGARD